jgi:UDP:flavonoid glycosyltransferase YjiC (YdhE family)
VSFGSVAGSLPVFPDLYRAAIAALADLPVRVLLTTGVDGDPSELGDLPPNVHVEHWIDQRRVLPLAAAVVGHGGHGSTLGTLFHGVPQALVPLFSGDQWANARRVGEVGAGIALTGAARSIFTSPGPDVVDALPEAVARLIENPGYRHTAERIAAAARALPGIDDALLALPVPTPQEALT